MPVWPRRSSSARIWPVMLLVQYGVSTRSALLRHEAGKTSWLSGFAAARRVGSMVVTAAGRVRRRTGGGLVRGWRCSTPLMVALIGTVGVSLSRSSWSQVRAVASLVRRPCRR